MRIDSYEVQGDKVVAVYVSDKRRNMKQFRYEQARPHGEWIDEGAMAEGHPHRAFNCSVCDGHIIRVDSDLPNFCEFCGADMREGEAE